MNTRHGVLDAPIGRYGTSNIVVQYSHASSAKVPSLPGNNLAEQAMPDAAKSPRTRAERRSFILLTTVGYLVLGQDVQSKSRMPP